MRIRYRYISIYLFSILILIFSIYFLINNFIKKPLQIINFIDSDIHENFEIEITNNLNDINNYLKEYLFIESYLFQRKDNEIDIYINLNETFAKNNSTREVIFYNNIKAPFNYFKSSYINNIKLIDISKKSIYINKYLNENFQFLSTLFDIDQIEYVDDRRYNLVLSNGRLIMLPKVIDKKTKQLIIVMLPKWVALLGMIVLMIKLIQLKQVIISIL